MWRQVNRSHLDAGEAGISARAALAEPADGKMHSEGEQAKPTHRAELRALPLRSRAHEDPPCCGVCYGAFCRDLQRGVEGVEQASV